LMASFNFTSVMLDEGTQRSSSAPRSASPTARVVSTSALAPGSTSARANEASVILRSAGHSEFPQML
jgi:hypothetical protein